MAPKKKGGKKGGKAGKAASQTGPSPLPGATLFAHYWGEFSLKNNRPADALKYFEEGLRVDPSNPILLKSQGKALSQLQLTAPSGKLTRTLSNSSFKILPHWVENPARPLGRARPAFQPKLPEPPRGFARRNRLL